MKTCFLVCFFVFGVSSCSAQRNPNAPAAPTSGPDFPRQVATALALLRLSNDSIQQFQVCPNGFILHNSHCVQQVLILPDLRCPPEYRLLYEGNPICVKFVSPIAQCPYGYMMAENQLCYLEKKIEADVACPQGYSFVVHSEEPPSQQCSRTLQLEPVPSCPPNAVLENENCVRYIEEEIVLECPEGFELETNACIQDIEYDCTHQETPTVYNRYAYPSLPKTELASRKFTRTGFTESLHPGFGSDLTVGTEKPKVVSDQLIRKLCKRTIAELPRKTCKEEAILLDSKCLRPVYTDVMMKPGGFKTEYAMAIPSCPLNGTLVDKHTCYTRTEVQGEFVCPKDTEVLNQKCVMYAQPVLQCPSEYSLKDRTCLRTLTAPMLTEYHIKFVCSKHECM